MLYKNRENISLNPGQSMSDTICIIFFIYVIINNIIICWNIRGVSCSILLKNYYFCKSLKSRVLSKY